MHSKYQCYSDKELIEQFCQGEVEALGELYDRYAKKAFGRAYRIIGQYEDAEDIVHDAWLKVINALCNARPNCFWAWFCRIVVNRCIDYLRRNKIFLTTSLDAADEDSDESQYREIADTSPSPLEYLVNKETSEMAWRAIGSLKSKNHRLLLNLRYYEDMSYEEIVDALRDKPLTWKVTEKNIKTYLARARKAFAVAYIKLLEEDKKNNAKQNQQ